MQSIRELIKHSWISFFLKRNFPVLFRICGHLYRTFVRINPFISLSYIYLYDGYLFNLKELRKTKIVLNLVIIGAPKSGTSSLHNYLNIHPDIFMSTPMKEPGFFIDTGYTKKGFKKRRMKVEFKNKLLKNDMLQGYCGQQIFGESPTYYTWCYNSSIYKIPENIKWINPKMKFIYMLRNPLERIQSNYLHRKKYDFNILDLNKYISNTNALLLTSLYSQQLNRFLIHFSKKQFKILIFEEFIENPQKSLNEIFEFLSVSIFDKYNKFEIYNKSNRISFTDNELLFTGENYNRLMSLISKDLDTLESTLGRSLKIWDLSKEKWCKT